MTGDKFLPKLHLNSQDLIIVLVEHLVNIGKEFKNLEKKVI